MAATATRFYNSTMRGLGGIDGTPGSFVNIFDKIASTGYGEVTAINITVVNGIATANFNPDESFQVNSTIRVSGSNIAALNGDHLVTKAGNAFASWPTGAADGVTSSVVTVKGAPLGFNIAFTGTNRRSYTSLSPESSGHFIAVDDTFGKYISICAYETMGDVSTGTNKTPATDPYNDWPKSYSADTTKRDWIIIGDDRGFYWGIINYLGGLSVGDISNQAGAFAFYYIGEGNDDTPIKNHCFLVFCERNVNHFGRVQTSQQFSTIASTDYAPYDNYPSYISHCVSRDHLGIGKSPRVKLQTEAGSGVSGSFVYMPPHPNPGNNKTFISRITVHEAATNMRRAFLPGAYALIHYGKGSLTTGSVIEDVPGLENRILMGFNSVRFGGTIDTYLIFDISGNWRA